MTMDDAGYTLDPASVSGPQVVLDLTNPTDADHEALVVRLDEGIAPEILLQGSPDGFPEGVTLVGQSTVPGGERGSMLLTDLPAGTYTIVDLLPDATGAPTSPPAWLPRSRSPSRHSRRRARRMSLHAPIKRGLDNGRVQTALPSYHSPVKAQYRCAGAWQDADTARTTTSCSAQYGATCMVQPAHDFCGTL